MRTPFEKLVTRLSTHFITLELEEIDDGIVHALGELGELCDVDRAYIFRFEGTTASNTHEWCREGIEPQREHFQNVPYEAFPWWVERIQQGNIVHIESLDELPEEASAEREILEMQSVQSIVAVPLAFGNEVFGFVGFDSVRHPTQWPEEDIALLRVVGEMLVHALVRQRTERERRQLEAQLAEARKLEAVGRLAGGVAHDFNNMLTVLMNLGMLLERSIEGSTQQAYAQEIVETSRRAAGLTRQLLSIGRRAVLSNEVIDLRRVIIDLEPLLRRSLRENIHLHTDLKPVGYVRVDHAQLEQVLVNLALNAADAMPRGGDLAIRLHGHDEEVTLELEDTGEGMSEAVAARAFEPFFTTKGDHGTGLGLATAYGIVTQAGGSIELDSTPGAGTRVRIRWPVTETRPAPSQRSVENPCDDGRGESILIVDDMDELRSVLHTVLEQSGYRVLTAADVDTALELLRDPCEPVDLVLTDVVMPGRSGLDLLREVGALQDQPSVILMSAYEEEPMDTLPRSVARLQKPFVADELLRAVRASLAAPSGDDA